MRSCRKENSFLRSELTWGEVRPLSLCERCSSGPETFHPVPSPGRHLQAALSQPAPGPVDGAMWSSLPSCRAHGLASALGHGKEAKDRDLPQRNLQTQKGGDTNQFEDEEDSNQLVSLTIICLSRPSSEGTQEKGVLPALTLKGTDIGSRDQKVKIARHLGAHG